MIRLLSRASLAMGGWVREGRGFRSPGSGRRYSRRKGRGLGMAGTVSYRVGGRKGAGPQHCPCPHSTVSPAKSVSGPRKGVGSKGREWGGVRER